MYLVELIQSSENADEQTGTYWGAQNGSMINEKWCNSGCEPAFWWNGNALTNEDMVEIRGICSFYVKKYNAYTGHNRPLYMDSVLL